MAEERNMFLAREKPELDIAYTRMQLREMLENARKSGNVFLIYILGMAVEELRNIERGTPTDF